MNIENCLFTIKKKNDKSCFSVYYEEGGSAIVFVPNVPNWKNSSAIIFNIDNVPHHESSAIEESIFRYTIFGINHELLHIILGDVEGVDVMGKYDVVADEFESMNEWINSL